MFGILSHLAGVSLCPGSESISPITLQVSRITTTTQKMMQLVPYITMAGKVMGNPVTIKLFMSVSSFYFEQCID